MTRLAHLFDITGFERPRGTGKMEILSPFPVNKEIASQLNLSEFTVRNHIHKILKQVDADSRGEAVETIRAYGYAIGS